MLREGSISQQLDARLISISPDYADIFINVSGFLSVYYNIGTRPWDINLDVLSLGRLKLITPH